MLGFKRTPNFLNLISRRRYKLGFQLTPNYHNKKGSFTRSDIEYNDSGVFSAPLTFDCRAAPGKPQ